MIAAAGTAQEAAAAGNRRPGSTVQSDAAHRGRAAPAAAVRSGPGTRCAMGVRDRQALGAGRWGGPRSVMAAAGLAGLVGVAGLAGCGSAAGNTASAPAATPTASASQVRSATSGTLCAGAGTVDRLTVIRL